MMEHNCIVDSFGFYKTIVQVVEEIDPENEENTVIVPYKYQLQTGEELVEAELPFGLIRPRWDGTNWEEGATEDEIAEAAAKKAEKDAENANKVPTQAERLEALESAFLALVLGGEK